MRVNSCNCKKSNESRALPVLTWEDIHKEEGVYKEASCQDSPHHLIVLKVIEGGTVVLFYSSAAGVLQPVYTETWCRRQFIKTNLTVCFGIKEVPQ